MKVFVTDGDNRAALAVTRSLGRAGHEVIVGERQVPSLAQRSKYCADVWRYPNPTTVPEEFLESVVSAVREKQIDMLVPIADITTFIVTGNRDRFAESCAIPFAPAATIARAADKVDVVRTAMRLGVPVPKSIVVDTPDDIPETDLEFPLVIKPWRSRLRTPEGWASSAVSYAADRDELERDLRSRPAHEFPVMLQERIVGPGVGVFACYHHGRAVAMFGHRRLRERPPWGGVSVLSESVEINPLAREYAIRLLDELGWHGVAMVEFKQDVSDNLPKLMEINGRFWGSLQLAVDAGVDFPALLAHGVERGHFAPQQPYRVGVKNRWLWGDFDSLLVTMFGGAGAPSIPSAMSRAKSAFEFLKFRGRNLYYDNPKWDDPGPWFFETKAWFKRTARDAMPRNGSAPAAAAKPASAPVTPATRTRIAASFEETGIDEVTWNALASRSQTNSVFQTWPWLRSWWSVYGDEYEPLFVTVSDSAGPLGVAPLAIENHNGERVVRFVGEGRADYCDFLTGGHSREVVTEAFNAVRDFGRWDILELNNIPEHSATPEIVRELCARYGFRLIIEHHFSCPTLLIRGHEAEAQAIVDKSSLRRRYNYFNREGRLVSRDLRSAEQIEPYLEPFFAQHIGRWRDSRSPSLFEDPRNREFYRTLTEALDGSDWLLFSAIEFNEQPIAFHYGFDYNDSMIWYKPSFDVAYAAHSPGLVMVRHLIDYGLTRKRFELDFTVGDEAFKRRFTNSVRHTVRIQVFRDSVRYLLECSSRKLMSAMKRLSGP